MLRWKQRVKEEMPTFQILLKYCIAILKKYCTYSSKKSWNNFWHLSPTWSFTWFVRIVCSATSISDKYSKYCQLHRTTCLSIHKALLSRQIRQRYTSRGSYTNNIFAHARNYKETESRKKITQRYAYRILFLIKDHPRYIKYRLLFFGRLYKSRSTLTIQRSGIGTGENINYI